jgi:TolA-binding protein
MAATSRGPTLALLQFLLLLSVGAQSSSGPPLEVTPSKAAMDDADMLKELQVMVPVMMIKISKIMRAARYDISILYRRIESLRYQLQELKQQQQHHLPEHQLDEHQQQQNRKQQAALQQRSAGGGDSSPAPAGDFTSSATPHAEEHGSPSTPSLPAGAKNSNPAQHGIATMVGKGRAVGKGRRSPKALAVKEEMDGWVEDVDKAMDRMGREAMSK